MPSSGLRFADDHFSVHGHQAPPNDQAPGLQINILPEKTKRLSSAKTREGQREPEGMKPVLFDACEERFQIHNLPGFDDAPEPGSQYVLVNVKATYTGLETGTFWIDVRKKFVGSEGNTFSAGGAVPPDPIDFEGEVFQGASVSGNWVFEVPSDQISGGCLMLDEYNEATRTFFAIK